MAALLALFVRSLRDDLRSKSLLWARVGIGCAIVIAIVNASLMGEASAPGLSFFSSVVWMNFLVICLAGLSYFSSSITEEKEEETLGLLRMTDLSPFAILLGKSTSRMIGGLMLLLVQLPFVMLAITLGGVSLEQVLKTYALLGAFLFFACNTGLLGSVIGRRSGTAAGFSAVIGAGYLLLPKIALATLTSQDLAGVPAPGGKALSNLGDHFNTPLKIGSVLELGSRAEIGGAVAVLIVGGLAAFFLARILFEGFCGEESLAVRQAVSTHVEAGHRRGSLARSPVNRAWDDAIAWRDFFFLHGGMTAMKIKAGIYIGIFVLFAVSVATSPSFIGADGFFTVVFVVSVMVGTFESLFATSRVYRLERKNKTLAGLYILPQDIDELIRAKRRGVLLTLTPVGFFAGISCFVLLSPFFQLRGEEFLVVVLGFAYVVSQAFLLHYLVAMFSLKLKWGGLPLALILWWLGSTFVTSLFTILLGILMGPILLIVATAVIALYVRASFRRRLIAAAREE